MANSEPLLHFLTASFIVFILTTTTSAAEIDIQPDDDHSDVSTRVSSSSLAQIFSRHGFQEMSAMAPFMYDSTSRHNPNIASAWPGPFTIFAPSDSSIDTCSSCSLPLLLQEHTVPGVYTFHNLQTIPFGSRIQTLIHNRCLTVTKSVEGLNGNGSVKVFVGGVEITRPDLHNDGYFVIHGLDGYVSHLSPLSCDVEKTTSLSFEGSSSSMPQPPPDADRNQPTTTVMRVMLDDVTLRLRSFGFSTLALALKIRYRELELLQSMTIFALNDIAIFRLGHGYVQNLGFHIVTNVLLTKEVLMSYPREAEIQTMEPGANLVITSAAGDYDVNSNDGLKINNVRVVKFELITNLNVVVHEISESFGHIGARLTSVEELRGFERWTDEYGDYGFEKAPEAAGDGDGIQSVAAEYDDYRGL